VGDVIVLCSPPERMSNGDAPQASISACNRELHISHLVAILSIVEDAARNKQQVSPFVASATQEEK
jgi:hypothetical protein